MISTVVAVKSLVNEVFYCDDEAFYCDDEAFYCDDGVLSLIVAVPELLRRGFLLHRRRF